MLKKIFFVGGNLYPFKVGGYEVFNYYLFNNLKNRYKVFILNFYKDVPEYARGGYVKLKNIGTNALSYSIYLFIYLLCLKDKKNSLIFLSYARSRWIHWWFYPILSKFFGLKYILVIHGGGLTAWDCRWVHENLLLEAKEVIGVSQRICDEYEKRTQRRIQFIPPVIPFQLSGKCKVDVRRLFGIHADAYVFLSVGSLKQIKNPQTIVSAAIELGKDFLLKNKIQFIFAGDGVLRTEMKQKVKENALEDIVLFLGNVKREILPDLYGASDAFIMCSDYEGTPISMLEAMFNSLIVIGSNVSGIKEMIKHENNGFLFEKNNSLELSLIIKTIINSEDDFKGMLQNNAKSFVDKSFDYQKMLNDYINIIDKI